MTAKSCPTRDLSLTRKRRKVGAWNLRLRVRLPRVSFFLPVALQSEPGATASESSEKQCRLGMTLRRTLLLRGLQSSGTFKVLVVIHAGPPRSSSVPRDRGRVRLRGNTFWGPRSSRRMRAVALSPMIRTISATRQRDDQISATASRFQEHRILTVDVGFRLLRSCHIEFCTPENRLTRWLLGSTIRRP